MNYRINGFVRAAALSALFTVSACAAYPKAGAANSEIAPAARHGRQVTVTRDDWGIAHVKGRTDADAVFGTIYAQAEDDFNRIETNYLVALGRLAEAEGEKAIWQDLRARLYMDPADLQRRHAAAPAWLQRLTQAWADGLNHYLATHPQVKPRVITRFKPWMALSFSEGSIGGDIERIDLDALAAFYGKASPLARTDATPLDERRGSNGIAIAPANSATGNALLLINPHTSFFFRSELQMTSEEGLNAYGAATWGQFFIYQGFNERVGWMHTSSGVDVVDEFAETIVRRPQGMFYRYGNEQRPIERRPITLSYRAADGSSASRSFDTYHSHHGPIVRADGDKWIAFAMMHKPVEALSQSWLRTKARNLADYMKVMELKANSSNNTIYADGDGAIAYLHPQFIPARDDRFDYTRPVDGSDPATDWRAPHALDQAPMVVRPANGWVMNTNNWPYSAAGALSPRPQSFPRYMDVFGENARGRHALALLEGRRGFTLESLRAAAYDSWQPAFAQLVPGLIAAWDALPATDPLGRKLAEPIDLLRSWDHRWSVQSVPTSLAMFWGEAMIQALPADQRSDRNRLPGRIEATAAPTKLRALETAIDRLTREHGGWRTPWGQINRFQRLTGDIVQPFSDGGPSIPVGFTAGTWGSLASFVSRPYPGTNKYYGASGNSFVAVVEFGDRVRARAVTAGGESGDPASPHFNDQAARYATGDLRPVYFHPDELAGHVTRSYRP